LRFPSFSASISWSHLPLHELTNKNENKGELVKEGVQEAVNRELDEEEVARQIPKT